MSALTVRGQYGPGFIGGERVPGYREEHDVAPNSQTETYVALKLLHRQLALGGHARSTSAAGKRLPKRSTEIAIRVPRRAAPALHARSV